MFVFIPQGGLCNRMRSLDSAMAIAQAAGVELVVEWYKDPNLMSEKFENIFEMPSDINKIITKNYMGPLGKLQKTIQKRLNKIKYKNCFYEKDLVLFLDGGGDLSELAKSGSLCIASCAHFYKDPPFFQKFRPVAAITKKVNEIMSDSNNVIGIHIRRDDHIEAIKRSPLELFEKAMNEEISNHSDVKFFIATDSVETEDQLKNLYGDRILTHPKSSLDRDDVAAIKDAMIDLYCLSETSKIIGSYGSSFSDVASQIKGIELVILDMERT